jgi:RimJ/RimL family protein N-acetyltransferase
MGRPGSLTAAGQHRPEVTLRPATEDDARLLLDLRNDPDAVRFSGGRTGVTPAEHREWLSTRLADPSTHLWIAEQAGDAVGQVRVDVQDGSGTVSLAIAPSHRGRGIGSAVLSAMVYEMEHAGDAHTLRAMAHVENTASIRAFVRAGFHRRALREGEFAVLERTIGREGGTGHNQVDIDLRVSRYPGGTR